MIGGIATEFARIGSKVRQLLVDFRIDHNLGAIFAIGFELLRFRHRPLYWVSHLTRIQDCDRIVQAHGFSFNLPELCLDWKSCTICRTASRWHRLGCTFSTQSNSIGLNCSRVADFPQLSHNPVDCKKWDPRLRQDFKILKMALSAIVGVRLDCRGPSSMGWSLPSTPDQKPVGGPLG